MSTRKRGKAGNKKVSKLAAGLGIHFHPGAPPPRVEADSEEAHKKARRGESEVTSTVENRAVRHVRRGKRARFDFGKAAKSTTVAPPAKKSAVASAKTGKKPQEARGKHKSTSPQLKNVSTPQSKKVQAAQQKKRPPQRKTVPQMNARPPPPLPPVQEQSSTKRRPPPSAATAAKAMRKKRGAEADKHRANGREETQSSLQQLEANEKITDRLAKLRLQPEATIDAEEKVSRTPVEGAPPIPCVSRKPQLTPRSPAQLASSSMATLTTSRGTTSKLARANKSESALMATAHTRTTPKPVAAEEADLTPISPAADTGRRASVGHVAMNIQKMEKGFTVANAELDWTDMFKGSVSAAQKAIEAQKVKVTREGIYIQSQRLTKKEGEPVFFRLRVANPKHQAPKAAASPTSASPRDTAAPKPSDTKSDPTSKPARRFPMAITRMDEGFEIPDDLKQYDVTDQFDGSVGKAKNAVECGQIACDKHGVFVLSKRLTKSSGHKVYFKLTRTTHDST